MKVFEGDLYMKDQKRKYDGGDLLVVVDMQKVYSKDGEWACLDMAGAAANIKKIIDTGAADNVVLTKYMSPKEPVGVWKDYCDEYGYIDHDPANADIIDELEVYGLPTYEKSTYSSWSVPKMRALLDEVIANNGRVVVTGVTAECCVLFTVLEAVDAGAKVIYLTDAVSGFTTVKEQGVLAVLSGRIPMHVETMTTEEYISEKA